MTLIPGTNREDGPCVVWIGTTIHGLDDVYGPFPNCVAAGDFIDKKVAEEWCSKENALVLMLDQSLLKADILLQSGEPTYDNVSELTKAMFPNGWASDDNEQNEVVIHTGLRISENPDAEDGLLERVWDDNDNEIPVPEEWYKEADAQPPIVTLDLKSACDAMLDICNEVFPGGKIGMEEPKDDIEMFLDEIESGPTDKSERYSDDVRLAAWAMLAEAGNETNAPIKPLDEITEADMNAWWEKLNA